jgi:hypothetical protein
VCLWPLLQCSVSSNSCIYRHTKAQNKFSMMHNFLFFAQNMIVMCYKWHAIGTSCCIDFLTLGHLLDNLPYQNKTVEGFCAVGFGNFPIILWVNKLLFE